MELHTAGARVKDSGGFAPPLDGQPAGMRIAGRLGFAFAVISLAAAFVFPLWRITLDAPQYPEGIGLDIRIDNVTGRGPHDLQNINGLNHYIGMKKIVPESIPELSIMPWVIGGLMVLGCFVVLTGSRMLGVTWLILLGLAMTAGLVDFYLWEYDYGHDLDPRAAIKVPGMAYQPPLIGTKKLLNFTASSWPGVGGWSIVVAFLMGFVALRLGKKVEEGR